MDQRSGLEERHRTLRKEAIRDAVRERFTEPMAVREAGEHDRQQLRAGVGALGERADRFGERAAERGAVADDVVRELEPVAAVALATEQVFDALAHVFRAEAGWDAAVDLNGAARRDHVLL